MPVFYTSYLQLRNSSLVYYNQAEHDNNNSFKSNTNSFSKSNRNSAYTGQVKEGTKKRIRKALDLFMQSTSNQQIFNPVSNRMINFRLAFITLTISNNTTQEHKFCYTNLLRPFLQWLDKTVKVNSYIWKAEVQKRGQIHYHLTISSFIHHTAIRDKWNYLQRKNNLIENNETPPSTEIKQVQKINNIEHYLAKYISKDGSDNNTVNDKGFNEVAMNQDCIMGNILSCYPVSTMNDFFIDSKVWDCSANLKKHKYFTLELNEKNASHLLKNNIEIEIIKEFETDNCLIVKTKEGYINKVLNEDLKVEYNNYVNAIKSNNDYVQLHKRNITPKGKTQAIREFDAIEAKFKSIKTAPTFLASPTIF